MGASRFLRVRALKTGADRGMSRYIVLLLSQGKGTARCEHGTFLSDLTSIVKLRARALHTSGTAAFGPVSAVQEGIVACKKKMMPACAPNSELLYFILCNVCGATYVVQCEEDAAICEHGHFYRIGTAS